MPRKTHNDRLDIPPLELECMKMLWTLGSATVHQVRAELLPTRPLAYTTVMTLMDRLARKGIAAREKRGRAFVYRPVLPEQSARDFALDRLTRNFFRGSRQALREHLAGDGARVVVSAMPTPAREYAAGGADTPARQPEKSAGAPPRAKPARSAVPERSSLREDPLDPSLL